ncbi:MAG: hypothetical protein SRB2_02583 [Desulfobacteraceae bacterium Eth-SRB2]|nr:MAG: hypothetical protein SRB2_02583 [Desulfobacteraceae bacterium Eth-SRB2]
MYTGQIYRIRKARIWENNMDSQFDRVKVYADCKSNLEWTIIGGHSTGGIPENCEGSFLSRPYALITCRFRGPPKDVRFEFMHNFVTDFGDVYWIIALSEM